MKCPKCGKGLMVVETVEIDKGVRRRRKCTGKHYYTTLEVFVGEVGQGRKMPEVTVGRPEKKGSVKGSHKGAS